MKLWTWTILPLILSACSQKESSSSANDNQPDDITQTPCEGQNTSLETDADCDGTITADDCDDSNPNINPEAAELWYDGIDQNCDGLSDYDQDGDGADATEYGGTDCDDTDLTINPEAAEIWYDGIDQNCDGLNDFDQDIDGVEATEYGGTDCNDTDSTINSEAAEIWYDGVDQNCDGLSDYDQDGDGADATEYGGTDCNDTDSTINSEAAEIWYDGVDQNCDGLSDYDQDGDGADATEYGGTDCDDTDSSIVNGDNDGDGYSACDGDCDDTDPYTFPGALYNEASPLNSSCSRDEDGDGYVDCHVVSNCDWSQYFVPQTVGADFQKIPAGIDPLGRYELSYDFYLMSTEVFLALYSNLMANNNYTTLTAQNYLSWYDAAELANQMSLLTGREECYVCNQGTCTESMSPLDCTGFRLPTEAEWEYAARSGTTEEIWTGTGNTLGGSISNDDCSGANPIQDGANNSVDLSDLEWYCSNSNYFPQGVAQKIPNGFGLYDMNGNVMEWTADYSNYSYPNNTIDPWYGTPQSQRVIKGGHHSSSPFDLAVDRRAMKYPNNNLHRYGVRIAITSP